MLKAGSNTGDNVNVATKATDTTTATAVADATNDAGGGDEKDDANDGDDNDEEEGSEASKTGRLVGPRRKFDERFCIIIIFLKRNSLN